MTWSIQKNAGIDWGCVFLWAMSVTCFAMRPWELAIKSLNTTRDTLYNELSVTVYLQIVTSDYFTGNKCTLIFNLSRLSIDSEYWITCRISAFNYQIRNHSLRAIGFALIARICTWEKSNDNFWYTNILYLIFRLKKIWKLNISIIVENLLFPIIKCFALDNRVC